jgi:hypothetical protein
MRIWQWLLNPNNLHYNFDGYRRRFALWFKFLGFRHWSLGIHFWPAGPHLQIHVPGGFFHIGWDFAPERMPAKWAQPTCFYDPKTLWGYTGMKPPLEKP